MPRTKGAKNKAHTADWYIAELKKIGVTAVVENEQKIQPELIPEKQAETVKTKAAFELQKPKPRVKENSQNNEEKTPNPNGTVIRCGNPACGKILDSEVPQCPHCGCNLTWQ